MGIFNFLKPSKETEELATKLEERKRELEQKDEAPLLASINWSKHFDVSYARYITAIMPLSGGYGVIAAGLYLNYQIKEESLYRNGDLFLISENLRGNKSIYYLVEVDSKMFDGFRVLGRACRELESSDKPENVLIGLLLQHPEKLKNIQIVYREQYKKVAQI